MTAKLKIRPASRQAPAAGESDDPCGETETVATVDRFPQTEVVDTQMLMEDVPPLQMTAPVVQLPSPPAAELPQAPDELMLEAQELPQSPAMQAAGQGDGATLPRSSLMSFDEPIELAAAQTVLPAAPLAEEEERVAAVVPIVRIPSPPSETASGMVTLGAVADAEPDQAEPLQPSAMLAAFGLASPPMSTALLRPFEFAATTGGQQSPEQLAATSARPAPQPVQPPPSGPVLRPPRGEQRVEPAAGGSAEQTLQGLVAPQLSPPKTLDEVRSSPPVTERAAAVLTASALTEHACCVADVGSAEEPSVRCARPETAHADAGEQYRHACFADSPSQAGGAAEEECVRGERRHLAGSRAASSSLLMPPVHSRCHANELTFTAASPRSRRGARGARCHGAEACAAVSVQRPVHAPAASLCFRGIERSACIQT